MELVNKAAETLADEFDVDVGYEPIDGRDVLIVSPRDGTDPDHLIDEISTFSINGCTFTHTAAYSNPPSHIAFTLTQ